MLFEEVVVAEALDDDVDVEAGVEVAGGEALARNVALDEVVGGVCVCVCIEVGEADPLEVALEVERLGKSVAAAGDATSDATKANGVMSSVSEAEGELLARIEPDGELLEVLDAGLERVALLALEALGTGEVERASEDGPLPLALGESAGEAEPVASPL